MTEPALTSEKRLIPVSVRELVDFVCKSGNLGAGVDFIGASRALQGTRGHQRIQKKRPEGYEPEVCLMWQQEEPAFILELKGRVDGIWRRLDGVLVEEIKTVLGYWNGQPDPLHWAQGKIYAALIAEKENLPAVEVQLTYLRLETEEVTQFREGFSAEALQEFFRTTLSVYIQWIRSQEEWKQLRDQSIRELKFPFPQYRPGQRSLAVVSYRTLMQGTRLFAEAPTGIGKTVSVLFPAIKAQAAGAMRKIFYLTAKTSGRAIAEKTLTDLRSVGLRLRSLTLTAKEKICFSETQPCDATICPFALGYYDRRKGAMEEALSKEALDRTAIEEIARKHSVCPFALALDLSAWVDLILCDYNYVFDPQAWLRRHFTDEPAQDALLVDEAHNLADRAREMFSAELLQKELKSLEKILPQDMASCRTSLRSVLDWFKQCRAKGLAEGVQPSPEAWVSQRLPEALIEKLETFQTEAERWLALRQEHECRQSLLQAYFGVFSFLRTAELFDESYAAIFQTEKRESRIRLFCLDPAGVMRKTLKRGRAALFFSATLTPLEYFREILGGSKKDLVFRLKSPFPAENLNLWVEERISTHYRRRSLSLDRIARAIAALVSGRHGNYLVFFPSYEYLGQVLTRFAEIFPDIPVLEQTQSMNDQDRQRFIHRFQRDGGPGVVGFAVMGGVFGEGIDLIGDQLVGAVIVGVGLPQICLERDLIRAYFDQKNGNGFDYAYTYPGMNRVLQAVGRVIRSETDRGVVLLIDSRFSEARYRKLFPPWWTPLRLRSEEDFSTAVKQFWGKLSAAHPQPNSHPR